MTQAFSILGAAIFILAVGPSLCEAQTRAATAYAIPLTKITIDGELDDWPKHMVHYPVINNARVYGPTDLDDADLTRSNDLTAYFMVGYDVGEQLIYVAGVVRDDVHTVGPNSWQTDAMEVYFEGLHREGREKIIGRNFAALQYAGVAGNGLYDSRENPHLMGDTFANTRSQFAYSRQGTVTIYEWALQSFDHFPDSPTKLDPGKRIGFEVVINDKDNDPRDAPAFICWGPMGGWKFYDAKLLGDLVLLDSADSLVSVAGKVTVGDTGKPYGGLIVEAHEGDLPAGFAITDADGHYKFALPPGIYTLKPAPFQATADFQAVQIKVTKDAGARRDLQIFPAQLPQTLKRALANYARLKAYRDRTLIRITNVEDDQIQNEFKGTLEVAFAKPNRINLRLRSDMLGVASIISDGEQLGVLGAEGNVDSLSPAPRVITPVELVWHLPGSQRYLPGNLMPRGDSLGVSVGQLAAVTMVTRLLMHPHPRRELLRGVGGIVELGDQLVDAEPATVVELTKLVPFAVNGMARWGSGMAEPNFMRLWIRKKDHLIVKVDYQFDKTEMVYGVGHSRTKDQVITITTTHQDIAVDPPMDQQDFQLPVPPDN